MSQRIILQEDIDGIPEVEKRAEAQQLFDQRQRMPRDRDHAEEIAKISSQIESLLDS